MAAEPKAEPLHANRTTPNNKCPTVCGPKQGAKNRHLSSNRPYCSQALPWLATNSNCSQVLSRSSSSCFLRWSCCRYCCRHCSYSCSSMSCSIFRTLQVRVCTDGFQWPCAFSSKGGRIMGMSTDLNWLTRPLMQSLLRNTSNERSATCARTQQGGQLLSFSKQANRNARNFVKQACRQSYRRIAPAK